MLILNVSIFISNYYILYLQPADNKPAVVCFICCFERIYDRQGELSQFYFWIFLYNSWCFQIHIHRLSGLWTYQAYWWGAGCFVWACSRLYIQIWFCSFSFWNICSIRLGIDVLHLKVQPRIFFHCNGHGYILISVSNGYMPHFQRPAVKISCFGEVPSSRG